MAVGHYHPQPVRKVSDQRLREITTEMDRVLKERFGIGGSLTSLTDEHGDLQGLTDDDHPYYVWYPGRPGGQLIRGDESTSSGRLRLMAYNDEPDATLGGSSLIDMVDANITVRADNLYIVERDTDYTTTHGFNVNTGAGFANVVNYGGATLNGMSSSSRPLTIDHSSAGLTVHSALFKARSSQTGRLLKLTDSADAELGGFTAAGAMFHVAGAAGGYVWTSDGSGIGSWADPTSLLDQDLIDIAGLTRTRGDLIVGGASAWVDLAVGTAGQVLHSDGTDVAWTNTITAAKTFRAASGVRSEAAATQDALVLAGRAGGTSGYAISLTPATLTGNRTVTLPEGGGNYTLAGLQITNGFTRAMTIQSGTDEVLLYLRPAHGGSSNIFETRDGSGNLGFYVDVDGFATFRNQISIFDGSNTSSIQPGAIATDRVYNLPVTTATSTLMATQATVNAGEIFYGAATSGLVAREAAFTYTAASNLLTVDNINGGATPGLLIGTAASNKLGFWGATTAVQPTTAVAAATFVTNTSLIANDSATFDGYTIGQVVKALRNMGLLA